ncbi:MAG: rubredoxin [Clostridiaceae bacterium]|jgi:rubredoxin|nr:rubredoxin [Clostridiaceae bacterium]
MKTLFKCTVCNYVHEGDTAPDSCPKCGAPKEKFEQLSQEAADKIFTSDRTNDIHMELVQLSMRIVELCEEGIEIDLDPPCVSAFKKAKDEAWRIKQRSKAELVGHISKGKF